MAWWHVPLTPPSRLIIACSAWVRSLESRAGGRLVLADGAEFGAGHYWWGKRKERPAPHEGVDFSHVGIPPRPLPAGFPLPAVADGEIVAIFDDFLAKTVIVRHEEAISDAPGGAMQGWPVCSLLAHVKLAASTAVGGKAEAEGHALANVAASRTSAPPHVHLSLLAAPTDFPWATLAGWPDLLARSASQQVAFLAPPLPDDICVTTQEDS
eukprot:TRINITY_DN50935_c0_g1_i1.p1 TRINITY_DN50935_c0_g1~~TRINITY_DN50935_c0_g1_i1.p1  ORF type:complete len:221 (-),score=43.16 TRINITY_DN50935_c0_g1_i1:71-703(-)